MTDSDAHWIQFLGNLGVHEAGFVHTETLVSKTASLTRDGAPELLAEAFRRGARCTGDFTAAGHLALAALPLSEVRDTFGVPPSPAELRVWPWPSSEDLGVQHGEEPVGLR